MKRSPYSVAAACLLISYLGVFELFAGSDEWPRTLSAAESAYGGDPTGIEIIGDRLFLSSSKTIAAYDVSDPNAIEFLGASLTFGSTWRMVAAGDRAYTVGSQNGFSIHDLSSPETGLPAIGIHEIEGSTGMVGAGVSGRRVFVSGHGPGLLVFDVSSPENPVLEGQTDDTGGDLYFAGEHIRVEGGLIYVAGHDDDYGAFMLYRDVPGSDPEFLSGFTAFDLPGEAKIGRMPRVEPNGSTAYVLNTGTGLLVIDVSDPVNLKLITPLDRPGATTKLSTLPADDFALGGDRIAAVGDGQLNVIDVSNPTGPILRGKLTLGNGDDLLRLKVTMAGTTAYAFDREQLHVVDISDMDAPVLVAAVPFTGQLATDVRVVGDLAYVAGSGIGVFDVSDPTAPVKVASSGRTHYQSMRLDGDHIAARITSSSSIDLIALGDGGRSPTSLGIVSPGSLRRYDLSGDRLWVIRPNLGLFSYAVGETPVQTSHWNDPDFGIDAIRVEGSTLYAGSGQLGFVIMDLSDPNAPELIGSLGGAEVANVEIDGTLAYAVRRGVELESEVVVIDISDPANPQELGTAAVAGYSGYVDSLTVGNGFLIGTRHAGATREFIVDISDPTDPRLVRDYLGCGEIESVDARGELLFAAGGYLGLQVLATSVATPQLAIDRALGLSWDAPDGVPFPVEVTRDLRVWSPLGRFDAEQLRSLDPLSNEASYFRARER